MPKLNLPPLLSYSESPKCQRSPLCFPLGFCVSMHGILVPSTSVQFSSVASCVQLFATPWIAARQASLSITNSRSSLKLTSIESVMPSSHLILCRPLFLLPQPLPASESFPMSQFFAWGGQSIGVSATLSVLPMNSVQSLSRIWLFVTPWTRARQASLSITNSRSPPKPMSIESIMPSNHLILHRPILLLPSVFPNDYSGLISFRIDWFDLAVQGLSRVFSNTAVKKHQSFGAQPSLWSNSHIHTWLLEKL